MNLEPGRPAPHTTLASLGHPKPPAPKLFLSPSPWYHLGDGMGGSEQEKGSGGSAVLGSPWSRWEKLENPIMVRLRLRVDLGFTAVSVLNNECRKLACLSNCCPVAKIKTLGCILASVYSGHGPGVQRRDDDSSYEHE